MAGMVSAQTTSRVSGQVNANINVTLLTGNNLFTNVFQINGAPLTPFISGTLSYGANGTGPSCANQLYIGQYLVTNGAAPNLNWINLYAPTNYSSSGVATDPVGNLLTIQNIKFIAIQNAGAVNGGNNTETNWLCVTTPAANGKAWTNAYGEPFMQCVIPSPFTNANATNTPVAILNSLGDIGFAVGATLSNTIVLTNPILGGPVLVANVYIIGSTNQ